MSKIDLPIGTVKVYNLNFPHLKLCLAIATDNFKWVIITYICIIRIKISVADPGSEERGGARGLGVFPQDFFANFSQFRGLF